jgi:hypothetical protein
MVWRCLRIWWSSLGGQLLIKLMLVLLLHQRKLIKFFATSRSLEVGNIRCLVASEVRIRRTFVAGLVLSVVRLNVVVLHRTLAMNFWLNITGHTLVAAFDRLTCVPSRGDEKGRLSYLSEDFTKIFLPHFIISSLDSVEMHLIVRHSSFHALHFIFQLFEMTGLLHKCIVMQGFVDEPHEKVDDFFVGACHVFHAHDALINY